MFVCSVQGFIRLPVFLYLPEGVKGVGGEGGEGESGAAGEDVEMSVQPGGDAGTPPSLEEVTYTKAFFPSQHILSSSLATNHTLIFIILTFHVPFPCSILRFHSTSAPLLNITPLFRGCWLKLAP